MIQVKITIDCLVTADNQSVLDIGAAFDFERNVGKVAHTYHDGNAVLMVNAENKPVHFSVSEADDIDDVFREVKQRQIQSQQLTAEQQRHILNYCLNRTVEILENQIEHELRPENVESQFVLAHA